MIPSLVHTLQFINSLIILKLDAKFSELMKMSLTKLQINIYLKILVKTYIITKFQFNLTYNTADTERWKNKTENKNC
jgi:hypothetical protein